MTRLSGPLAAFDVRVEIVPSLPVKGRAQGGTPCGSAFTPSDNATDTSLYKPRSSSESDPPYSSDYEYDFDQYGNGTKGTEGL